MIERIKLHARRMAALGIPETAVRQTLELLDCVPEILIKLENPAEELSKKHAVIDKLFQPEVRETVKVLCDENEAELLPEVFKRFIDECERKEKGKLFAKLYYVTPPTAAQLEGIHDFLQKKYEKYEISVDIIEDKTLVNGFIIKAGSDVYDWSAQGRIRQFEEKIKAAAKKAGNDSIISIIRSEIENFEVEAKGHETGIVRSVGDGIAVIKGLDHAAYGEIVLFDTGAKGMVQDIRRNETGCILFGTDRDISEGCKVISTGRRAGIPVGEGFLGRVVNPLGAPVDGLGDITEAGYNLIENPAPGIIDRKSVSKPMETGILSIDAMFPIGRGQRELIIGDRQTGKTALAIDTILNQKGKDVICVYVAIGQKASSVSRVVETLRKHGALEYTIIVFASASDTAPIQYIAPYSGCAMAEYFMNKGKDTLIVYDDLSKHAVAYRALSLLLGRAPGREAYPGDVFYLHSRLLERAASLSDAKGGGSMTALPIIETQAGDVSAYIPTNVISITDGQIFLESDLFLAGQRPAVNVGLSVSRVGGAAQTKAMKKAAGSIRLELAQYREMEVFNQFSSDLDESTKEQLRFGEGLMMLLRQKQYSPLKMWQQVVTLVAAEEKAFLKVPVNKIKDFHEELLAHFEKEHGDICSELTITGELSQDTRERIAQVAKSFTGIAAVPAGR